MYALTARTKTSSASKYLQQLCKHFAHKVPARYDTSKGEVDFVFGPCAFEASETELLVALQVAEKDHIEQARAVIDNHLERFAWKEELKLSWDEPQAAS